MLIQVLYEFNPLGKPTVDWMVEACLFLGLTFAIINRFRSVLIQVSKPFHSGKLCLKKISIYHLTLIAYQFIVLLNGTYTLYLCVAEE